ncbi:unnamed protein product [Notodromas monacha]|uniref:Uncharacterized protein n=1 Tax=Notodromas monacha TaxID=399045 RepID=A0A7R9G9A8_9CRUS|nr:unnamed protein product [Notodromas monacha]CAG0912982.1 unnamed protein product [Notodromas monacha]
MQSSMLCTMTEKEMIGGCCVCSDDQGYKDNPLVYCDGDGCSVAVHQACYGIVSVPKGDWYCSKCQSTERTVRVRCELCPSKEGAFKKADNGGWAHVVCALYIPEVTFQDVTTMELILLKNVPGDRFKRTCFVCLEANQPANAASGACMTCKKSGCKLAFHVTCGQSQGLLCEEAGLDENNVTYCGYCPSHYKRMVKHRKEANMKPVPAYKPLLKGPLNGGANANPAEALRCGSADGSVLPGNVSDSSSTSGENLKTLKQKSSSDVKGKNCDEKRMGRRQRSASGRSSASPVAAVPNCSTQSNGNSASLGVRPAATNPREACSEKAMSGPSDNCSNFPAGVEVKKERCASEASDEPARCVSGIVGVNGKERSDHSLSTSASSNPVSAASSGTHEHVLDKAEENGLSDSRDADDSMSCPVPSPPAPNYNDLSSLVVPKSGKGHKRLGGDSGGKRLKRLKKTGRRSYSRSSSVKSSDSRRNRDEPMEFQDDEEEEDSGEEPLSGSYTSKSGLIRGLNGVTASHMLGNEINTGVQHVRKMESDEDDSQSACDFSNVQLNVTKISLHNPSFDCTTNACPPKEARPASSNPSTAGPVGKSWEPLKKSSSYSAVEGHRLTHEVSINPRHQVKSSDSDNAKFAPIATKPLHPILDVSHPNRPSTSVSTEEATRHLPDTIDDLFRSGKEALMHLARQGSTVDVVKVVDECIKLKSEYDSILHEIADLTERKDQLEYVIERLNPEITQDLISSAFAPQPNFMNSVPTTSHHAPAPPRMQPSMLSSTASQQMLLSRTSGFNPDTPAPPIPPKLSSGKELNSGSYGEISPGGLSAYPQSARKPMSYSSSGMPPSGPGQGNRLGGGSGIPPPHGYPVASPSMIIDDTSVIDYRSGSTGGLSKLPVRDYPDTVRRVGYSSSDYRSSPSALLPPNPSAPVKRSTMPYRGPAPPPHHGMVQDFGPKSGRDFTGVGGGGGVGPPPAHVSPVSPAPERRDTHRDPGLMNQRGGPLPSMTVPSSSSSSGGPQQSGYYHQMPTHPQQQPHHPSMYQMVSPTQGSHSHYQQHSGGTGSAPSPAPVPQIHGPSVSVAYSQASSTPTILERDQCHTRKIKGDICWKWVPSRDRRLPSIALFGEENGILLAHFSCPRIKLGD